MWFLLVFTLSVFFLGVFGILLNRVHLLTVMLCLELLLVSLFMKFCLFGSIYIKFSFFGFGLLLLTLSACEAGVGLSLLVSVSRGFGNDSVFSLSVLRL